MGCLGSLSYERTQRLAINKLFLYGLTFQHPTPKLSVVMVGNTDNLDI